MKLSKPGWDHLIGLSLAAGYVAWVIVTTRTLGFARDEGFYFQASTQYARWLELLWDQPSVALQRASTDRYWAINHEHPSLIKTLFGLSWLLLHNKWQWIEQASLAFRLPAILMGGGTLWLTHVFGARAYGRAVGVVAAMLLALMPRFFYHAHLACFDVPIVFMGLLTVFAWWKASREGGWFWPVATGLAYGLMLETKHNAWMLPAVLVGHAAAVVVLRRMAGQRRIPWSLAGALGAMAVLGPLLLVGLWPWLWHDTVERFRWYANFHLQHDYYNMEFLGRNYFSAPSPRGYLPVMTIATVPTITLVLFGIGGIDRVRQAVRGLREWFGRRRAGLPPTGLAPMEHTDILLALALAAPLSPWLLSSHTPIFGGTKHWMTAYPFLCLFAGLGFVAVVRPLEALLNRYGKAAPVAGKVAVAATCLAAPLALTHHSHPFGLSSYVPLVGGTAGAADCGLNRQFWGFTTQSANEYLAREARRHATVFIHDTAWQSWSQMLAENRVRPDLRGVGRPSDAAFSLVHHELHMNEVDYSIWVAYGTTAPAHVVTHDGVPIVSIYRKP